MTFTSDAEELTQLLPVNHVNTNPTSQPAENQCRIFGGFNAPRAPEEMVRPRLPHPGPLRAFDSCMWINAKRTEKTPSATNMLAGFQEGPVGWKEGADGLGPPTPKGEGGVRHKKFSVRNRGGGASTHPLTGGTGDQLLGVRIGA